MSIKLTVEAEKERIRANIFPKTTWEIFRTTSLVSAVHKARELGWGDKKVQVRIEHKSEDVLDYVVEPFEKECSCPNILRFDDYFLRPDDPENVD